MNARDLVISSRDGEVDVRVRGRANFEYAVPLREIARKPETLRSVKIELAECTAMDSTFMGVLTMLSVAARRRGFEVELRNASNMLQNLLKGLGVLKLFRFTQGDIAPEDGDAAVAGASSKLDTAETVVEAHKILGEADHENVERFSTVIRFAEADAEKLRREEKK